MLNRRLFLSLLSAAVVAPSGRAFSQPASPVIKHARTRTLDIAYEESGPQNGIPVIGHDVPQEAPKETVAALLELVGARR